MPANKFRFISPGIQFHEVDESTIPSQIAPVGPVVVGRSMKGPGLVPTRVRDYDEFVKVLVIHTLALLLVMCGEREMADWLQLMELMLLAHTWKIVMA